AEDHRRHQRPQYQDTCESERAEEDVREAAELLVGRLDDLHDNRFLLGLWDHQLSAISSRLSAVTLHRKRELGEGSHGDAAGALGLKRLRLLHPGGAGD